MININSMKTKIIPFDLETAKKIQAGEIKGKIVDNNDFVGTIVTFNGANTPLPIVVKFEFDDADNIFFVGLDGVSTKIQLHIELPEEAPKQDSFNKKLQDTAEVLATQKHEFKEGDRVIINVNRCRPKLFFELYQNKIGTVRFTNNSGICVIVDDGKFQDIFIQSELKFLSQQNNNSDVSDRNYKVNDDYQFKIGDKVICYLDSIKMGKIIGQNANGTFIVKNMLGGTFVAHADDMELHGPQFKPFDKVLVRHPDKTELCVSNSIWIPGIFQYKNINSNLYFVSGKAYKACIPYEGNEHLVGTTNEPE